MGFERLNGAGHDVGYQAPAQQGPILTAKEREQAEKDRAATETADREALAEYEKDPKHALSKEQRHRLQFTDGTRLRAADAKAQAVEAADASGVRAEETARRKKNSQEIEALLGNLRTAIDESLPTLLEECREARIAGQLPEAAQRAIIRSIRRAVRSDLTAAIQDGAIAQAVELCFSFKDDGEVVDRLPADLKDLAARLAQVLPQKASGSDPIFRHVPGPDELAAAISAAGHRSLDAALGKREPPIAQPAGNEPSAGAHEARHSAPPARTHHARSAHTARRPAEPATEPAGASEKKAEETASWLHFLRDSISFYENQTAAEKEAWLDLKAQREAHSVVGATSETLAAAKGDAQAVGDWVSAKWHHKPYKPRYADASVELPEEGMWDRVFAHLHAAQALVAGDHPNIDGARAEMTAAVHLFKEAHRRFFEYRSRTEEGAGLAIDALRGVEVACDITLTVLSAGTGAGAVNVAELGVGGTMKALATRTLESGLLRTGLKAAAMSGGDRLLQGATEAGVGAAVGLESFDAGKVLRDAGENALMTFLGVFVGGKLSGLFMRKVGEVLGARLAPEALLALAEKYGVVGAIPPELFVTKGWRFLVGAAGDACMTTLLTALSVTISHLRTGGKSPNAEQFVSIVVEQMIQNGLLQTVFASLTHAGINERQQAARDFYKRSGWTDEQIYRHMRGIDFTKPVEVVTLKKGMTVSQYRSPDVSQGNYYSLRGYSPTELGIGPKGVNANMQVVDKVMGDYEVVEDVQVLKSRCSAPDDIWSIRGSTQHTTGGGEQFFSTNTSAFKLTGDGAKGHKQ